METFLPLLVDFTKDVFSLALVVLAPLLAAALTGFLIRLAQKYGLEVDANKQARLEKIIQDLILRVEEWAHYQAKLTGTPVTSTQKQTKFADLALIAGLPSDGLTALRDQELPKVRALLGE